MTSEMKSSEVKKQSSGAKKKKKVSWGSEDMVFIPEHVSASPRLKPSQVELHLNSSEMVKNHTYLSQGEGDYKP